MDEVGQSVGLVCKCIGYWTYSRSFVVIFRHLLVPGQVIICFVCVVDRVWRKNSQRGGKTRVVGAWYGGKRQ